jgi:malate synthase
MGLTVQSQPLVRALGGGRWTKCPRLPQPVSRASSSLARPYIPRRAMLYGTYSLTDYSRASFNICKGACTEAVSPVPGSNPRMIERSLDSFADSVCYDLEDSVSPGKKADARRLVSELLNVGWEQDSNAAPYTPWSPRCRTG